MSALETKDVKAQLSSLLQKPQAFLAVFVVVVVLDVAFVLRWQVVSLQGMFKESGKLKSDIVATYSESKESAAQQKELKDLLAKKERLDQMFIGREDLPKVLQAISEFAKLSSVRIQRIQPVDIGKPAAGAVTQKVDRQKISITASAGYHELGRFIGLLESGSFFVDFKNVEIQGDATPGTKQQRVTILLEVLKRKE
ncbi:MAG: hypothetical protein ACM3L6_07205 [Deltaproteobacteria bacterium]